MELSLAESLAERDGMLASVLGLVRSVARSLFETDSDEWVRAMPASALVTTVLGRGDSFRNTVSGSPERRGRKKYMRSMWIST